MATVSAAQGIFDQDISTGQIDINTSLSIDRHIFLGHAADGNYNVIFDGGGADAIYLGGVTGGDRTNYYYQPQHVFESDEFAPPEERHLLLTARGAAIGAPIGGPMGPGSLNVRELYIDGVALRAALATIDRLEARLQALEAALRDRIVG